MRPGNEVSLFSAASVAEGVPPPEYEVGLYELLKIAFEAHVYQEKVNAEQQTVLMGLRRNGMLSYRPRVTSKKLVRSSEQQWAREMPEGSHRMPRKWIEKRFALQRT